MINFEILKFWDTPLQERQGRIVDNAFSISEFNDQWIEGGGRRDGPPNYFVLDENSMKNY